MLRDRQLAGDVVQEAVVRAWRHCGLLSEGTGPVRGWLAGVAGNVAVDMIRMRRSRPAGVIDGAVREAVAEDPADAVVMVPRVRDALARPG